MELQKGLKALFEAMQMDNLLVETSLELPILSFIQDFIFLCDEIRSEMDIVNYWHVDISIATEIFHLFMEVLRSESKIVEMAWESKDTDEEYEDEECTSDEDSD